MQTSDSSSRGAERRQNPRTKLAEIAYIGMGPENGGLVLDVSDGGLSFHSVAPIEREEKVQFLLSLRGHSRIEGTGQVVWTNQLGTVCGMRFTSLSPGALEQLYSWKNQSNTSTPARPKTVTPVPHFIPLAAKASTNTLSLRPAKPAFAIAPSEERKHSANGLEVRGQSPIFWMAVGALAMLFASLTFWYGVRVGKTESSDPRAELPITVTQANVPIAPTPPASKAQLSGDPQPGQANLQGASKITSSVTSQALSTASKAEAIPSPVASVPFKAKPVSSQESATGPVAAVPVATAPSIAKVSTEAPKPTQVSNAVSHPSPDTGNSEYAAALADLNGDNGKRDTDSAIHLLQVATKKGNTLAEVTLADLYIYGDGVTQDCEHGRSLLTEAAKSGDVRAKLKLDELNTGSCP